MDTESNSNQQLLEAIRALRDEVAQLSQRVARIEAAGQIVSPLVAPPKSVETKPTDTHSDELIAVLSAAVAAYLGVKARIRHIQLISSPSWAQHGRATIQASHSLQVHHG